MIITTLYITTLYFEIESFADKLTQPFDFAGIPLEMSQPGWRGTLRVVVLYMAGVVMGSLAASIIKPTQYLLGASPGVYALISAHLGEANMVIKLHLIHA